MNKNEFIQTLRQALPKISPSDLSDIMADFEEHFASGLARGKSEAEICSELGSPYEIAQQYKDGGAFEAEIPNQQSVPPTANAAAAPAQPAAGAPSPSPAPAANPSVNQGTLIAVILLNIFLGIPIWISLFSTLFGLWAAAGGIGVAAIVLFVVAITQAGIASLILALCGLALTALTVLAIILMVYLTKWLCMGVVMYCRWNRKLVMGGSPA